MARDDQKIRVIAQNRRARHEFEILEEFEAGIELVGPEVKSLRGGRASIQEAWGRVRGEEAYLVGAHIPEYSHAGRYGHEPVHDRRLLLHKREILRIGKRVHEKGITLVPLEIYFKGHLVKLRLALVQGKKLYDKRQTAKDRDAKREMERAMQRRRG